MAPLVMRAGATSLTLMVPAPLELLARLPGRPLLPLPLEFGRQRRPTGQMLRRSSEGLRRYASCAT